MDHATRDHSNTEEPYEDLGRGSSSLTNKSEIDPIHTTNDKNRALAGTNTTAGKLRRVLKLFAPGEGPSLREVTRDVGVYPLATLTLLNIVDEIDQAALAVFAPNIRDYFGINDKTIGLIIGVQVSLLVIAAVPIGYVATKVDRARLLRFSAMIWSFFSTMTAFAIWLPMFMLARLGAGTGKASVDPVGKSLLADYYPPTTWNRVFAIHNAANPTGNIIGPLLAGAVAWGTGFSPNAWRWAFPILTVPTVVAILMARKLAEPGTQLAKGYMAATLTVTGAPPELTFRVAAGRILRVPTFRRQLVGIGVLGFALIGIAAFASILYRDVFGVGEGGRSLIFGFIATASLVGNLLGGSLGERVFQRSPKQALYLVGTGIAANSLILAAGVFLPRLFMVVAIQWLAILAITLVVAPMNAVMTSICPSRLRALMLSLVTLSIALFGGVFGGVFVGAISDWTGDVRWGLASLAPFGVVGGLLMARGGKTIDADIAHVARCDPFGEPL